MSDYMKQVLKMLAALTTQIGELKEVAMLKKTPKTPVKAEKPDTSFAGLYGELFVNADGSGKKFKHTADTKDGSEDDWFAVWDAKNKVLKRINEDGSETDDVHGALEVARPHSCPHSAHSSPPSAQLPPRLLHGEGLEHHPLRLPLIENVVREGERSTGGKSAKDHQLIFPQLVQDRHQVLAHLSPFGAAEQRPHRGGSLRLDRRPAPPQPPPP
jgi:hypothetical protein